MCGIYSVRFGSLFVTVLCVFSVRNRSLIVWPGFVCPGSHGFHCVWLDLIKFSAVAIYEKSYGSTSFSEGPRCKVTQLFQLCKSEPSPSSSVTLNSSLRIFLFFMPSYTQIISRMSYPIANTMRAWCGLWNVTMGADVGGVTVFSGF